MPCTASTSSAAASRPRTRTRRARLAGAAVAACVALASVTLASAQAPYEPPGDQVMIGFWYDSADREFLSLSRSCQRRLCWLARARDAGWAGGGVIARCRRDGDQRRGCLGPRVQAAEGAGLHACLQHAPERGCSAARRRWIGRPSPPLCCAGGSASGHSAKHSRSFTRCIVLTCTLHSVLRHAVHHQPEARQQRARLPAFAADPAPAVQLHDRRWWCRTGERASLTCISCPALERVEQPS